MVADTSATVTILMGSALSSSITSISVHGFALPPRSAVCVASRVAILVDWNASLAHSFREPSEIGGFLARGCEGGRAVIGDREKNGYP